MHTRVGMPGLDSSMDPLPVKVNAEMQQAGISSAPSLSRCKGFFSPEAHF